MKLLCSTGVLTRFPDRTEHQPIIHYGPLIPVDGFELLVYPNWRADTKQIAEDLRRSGLRFPVIHAEKTIGAAFGSDDPVVQRGGIERLRDNCRLGRVIGADTIVLHLWDLPQSDDCLDNNLAVLGQCVEIAEFHAMKLGIETILCRRQDPLRNIREVIAADSRCFVVLDTEFLARHNQVEAAGMSDWLWEKSRVCHIHVKDHVQAVCDAPRRYLHPGEGVINFENFFATLGQRQFNGTMSLEASAVGQDGAVQMPRLLRSIAYLRDLQEQVNRG